MPRTERPNMADYGVPEELEGVLPWEWAQERLVVNRSYWVVTVSDDHRPHAMPVWGCWNTVDDTFWFSAAPSALKVRNIGLNPYVVVTTADTVEVVSVEGLAERRQPADGIADGWATKYATDDQQRVELAEFFGAGAVFRVTPQKVFGLIEREAEFGQRATRWVW